MFGKGFGHNSGPHPAPEDAAARGPGSAGVQRGLWAARPTSSSPSAPTRALVLGVHAGPSTSSTGEGSTHAASQAPPGLPQPWASPDSLVTQRPPLAWRPYGVLSYSASYPTSTPTHYLSPFQKTHGCQACGQGYRRCQRRISKSFHRCQPHQSPGNTYGQEAFRPGHLPGCPVLWDPRGDREDGLG